MTFVNPCSGKRWQELPSGLFEIEGEGIPTLKPGTAAYDQMLATWRNWGPLLAAAGQRWGVPVPWMLAVATMETGAWSSNPTKQATIVSSAGAVGVMQVMPATASGFGRSGADMANPALNIDTAAQLIAKLMTRTSAGLPAISAYYNSGKLCSTLDRNEWALLADANYPRRVMEWNNAAILAGIGGMSEGLVLLMGMAFGALMGIAWVSSRG